MMKFTPTIQLNNITFTPEASDKPLFTELSLNFSQEKIGFVGRNGTGKSSLLKLITGDLQPTAGAIHCNAEIAYLPQDFLTHQEKTVAKVLGIEEKLTALDRINKGSIDEKDYVILEDDWLIKDKAIDHLSRFDLTHIDFNQHFSDLSGGEQIRLELIRIFIKNPDFILLDEPTNNLDYHAKKLLQHEIERFKGGCIVVSHDRSLLRNMHKIIEINSINVATYGGSYDNYVEQKEIEITAAKNKLQNTIQQQKKSKKIIQERMEKYDKNVAKGNRIKKAQIKAKGRIDKIGINAAKGRSEATNKRIRNQASRKMDFVDGQLQKAKSQLENLKTLSYSLAETKIPNTKILLSLENINFSYNNKKLFKNFCFKMVGPERTAVIGQNGTGKTTLVKLITNAVKPQSGKIQINLKNISYLDQNFSLLSPDKTILENYQHFNPDQTDLECRSALSRFLFRNKSVNKSAGVLSGGEKLRALLACIFMSNNPPELIILDEPTNNLDLDNITFLENTLKDYTGALLVISHDRDFLDNLGITQYIKSPFV